MSVLEYAPFTLLPEVGKRDVYPMEGRLRTSAMAEGAIEGTRCPRATRSTLSSLAFTSSGR